LFLRLAASQDKAGILQLAQQGLVVALPADLLRDPYVFEFLKIPEPHSRMNPARFVPKIGEEITRSVRE